MKSILPLLLVLTLGAGATKVTITSPAVVRGNTITLGEIAVIDDAADDAQARLGQVVLGVAPPLGQSRSLPLAIIRVHLRQHGFDPDALTLDSPVNVQVTRMTVTVPGDTLLSVANEWLRQRLAPADGDTLAITPVRRPADVQVPLGEMNWSCVAAGAETGTLRHVIVTLRVDGATAWCGVISFTLQRTAEVLVTRIALSPGAPIEASAVMCQRCDISAVAGTPLRDPGALVGLRAAVTLAAGTVLTAEKLEAIPLVKRNQIVSVQAHCGAMLLRTMAIALQDGAAGATIRLRNPDTREEFTARVVGPGELALDL